MSNLKYYEPRYISKTSQQSKYSFFDTNSDKKKLKDYIFEYDKIILLGNPGIGKTIELSHLFDILWEEKGKSGLTPFSINLKYFRKNNNFDDLIPYKEWEVLPNVVFILDGLDEIEHIQDFLSAFEIFISTNRDRSIKYVISCRTNIYEKYLISISSFETFFLENLSVEQAGSILQKVHNVEINDLRLEKKHYVYLQTPFFLNLLAEYYKENGDQLPQSDAMMWDRYVKYTIENHKYKKVKSGVLNVPKIITHLEKMAFSNELMQKNYFTEDELYKILGEEGLSFIEYPFVVEENKGSKKWSFEHRQLQEYFVAKSLSEKTFDEILAIIKIENLEVIHPSFFNVVSFLINLIDDQSVLFKDLIQWIDKHQIELLFKADSDRVSHELKEKAFRGYFYKECIEKSYWINTNQTYSVSEVAKFGNIPSNFTYLMDVIRNKNMHFRVVASALELIAFFDIPHNELDNVKTVFYDMLISEDISESIKSTILRCVKSFNFIKDDEYLDKLYKFILNEDGNEINSSFLHLIIDTKDVDRFFDYIFIEFQRIKKIIKRSDNDDVRRGNDWSLDSLVRKLNNPDNYINIISYYFQEITHADFYSHDEKKIIEKCNSFSKQDKNFVIKLLKAINGKTNYYTNDKLLKDIIIGSNNIYGATEYLIDNNPIDKVDYFISSFINQESFEVIRIKYLKEELINENIERFRNFIWSINNPQLSMNFNEYFSKLGFVSDRPFHSIEEVQIIQDEIKKKRQDDFDKLFDPDLLFSEIESIFDKYDIKKLDPEKARQIEKDWYDTNGYWNTSIDVSIKFLTTLIYGYRELDLNDIKRILGEEYELFDFIETLIGNNKNSNNNFIISETQIKIINEWTVKTSKTISFDKIFENVKINTFNRGRDYSKLKSILFFFKLYNANLDKQFLLNCIGFYEMESSNNDESFDFLFDKIDDKKSFDNRIVENLLTRELFTFSLSRHIDYSLDNKLTKTYSKIRECFLIEMYEYNLRDKIEKYYLLTLDVSLLKECCKDIVKDKCWSAIEILSKYKIEKEFCCEIAIKYILSHNQLENNYLSKALQVLFEFNKIEAIKYLLFLINHEFSINESAFSNYKEIEDYHVLKDLFVGTYQQENKYSFSSNRTFLNTYVANLSKTHDSYIKVQAELKEIRAKVKNNNSNSDTFYINLLIDLSENSYINEMSKNYSFDEALKLVQTIIN